MIIDTKIALEKSNGNEELAKELFNMLLSELPKMLKSIKESFDSNSQQELLNSAHRLFGSTAYCGVPDLKLAAQKLEICLKNNDQKNLLQNINAVEASIQSLLVNSKSILRNDW